MITSVPLATRQQFYNTVQANGLAYVHTQLVNEVLAFAASTMRHMGSGSGQFSLVNKITSAVPWLTIGGLYLGIVALAVTGPVGWRIAAGGLALGGVGLLGGC